MGVRCIKARIQAWTFCGIVGCLMVTSAVHADTVTYYHHDVMGSPIIATDSSGDVIWKKTYRPFGSEIDDGGSAAQSNQLGFTGHRVDPELDLVYAGARYYDSAIGRFTSRDPAGVREGNPQSFNLYLYGNNNPYRFIDPDGRIPLETIWDAINIGIGVESARSNFSNGNVGAGLIDVGGIIVDSAAALIPYVPGGVGTAIKSARAAEQAVGGAKKVDLKQTGSYTNTHASGKTYVGKGSRQRSQKSARREARRNNDPHVATDWTSAKNNREAFKQESRRLDAEGGPSSPTNYNRIEQPGKKYRQQDREF